MAVFNPCMKFEIFFGQMPSFEVLWMCHYVILSKSQAPSKCLFKWIKVDKYYYLKNRPHNFKNTFYFGHSDWEPSSVMYYYVYFIIILSFFSVTPSMWIMASNVRGKTMFWGYICQSSIWCNTTELVAMDVSLYN